MSAHAELLGQEHSTAPQAACPPVALEQRPQTLEALGGRAPCRGRAKLASRDCSASHAEGPAKSTTEPPLALLRTFNYNTEVPWRGIMQPAPPGLPAAPWSASRQAQPGQLKSQPAERQLRRPTKAVLAAALGHEYDILGGGDLWWGAGDREAQRTYKVRGIGFHVSNKCAPCAVREACMQRLGVVCPAPG